MGSGETAPTMVSVHQDLMSRVGSPPAPAVMLDTPYGFEENSADITSKALNYFAVNVGHPLEVASLLDYEDAPPAAVERVANHLREARYVFAGPGSPSYALTQWQGTQVPDLLRARLAAGGCISFASAAATTLGRVALPVYEIYKVGRRPHWVDGLDVLAEAGLDVAVLPHYDNTQGGTHDTRFCFMGERRLLQLEEMLPEGSTILGIAEHTAAIIDCVAGTMEVRGKGFVAHRAGGEEARFEAGETVGLDSLRRRSRDRSGPAPAPVATAPEFDAALKSGDSEAAIAALLAMEERLSASQSSPDPASRSLFRGMLVRLGQAAGTGLRDTRPLVAPFVELALELRRRARADGRYSDADGIRDALLACGVEIRDGREKTEWEWSPESAKVEVAEAGIG